MARKLASDSMRPPLSNQHQTHHCPLISDPLITDYSPPDYSLSPFLIVPRGFFGKEDATALRADTKRARCAGATRRISSINSRTQYSSAYCRLVGRAAALIASGFSDRRINLNNFTVAWLGTVRPVMIPLTPPRV